MEETMKDESKENNSTLTDTSAHETGIQSFSFQGTQEVQVVIIDGNPWFAAVDVCNALNLQNTSNILQKTLESDEYLPYIVYRVGQKRTINVVNESGLYTLIFQSRKPIAKKFRKWVTSVVLPTILKTGMYATEPVTGKFAGQFINVTGADNNPYMRCIVKAMREFIVEEIDVTICSELRLSDKIKAARTLFPEERKSLRGSNAISNDTLSGNNVDSANAQNRSNSTESLMPYLELLQKSIDRMILSIDKKAESSCDISYKPILTEQEACTFLGVSRRYLHDLRMDGKIGFCKEKRTSGKKICAIRYRREHLMNYIKDHFDEVRPLELRYQ